MSERRSSEQRAQYFARLYPRPWRSRYEDEFVQQVAAELDEHGASLRWSADIFAHALWARVTYAGLAGEEVEAPRRLPILLAALLLVLGGFATFAIGMWSQLNVDGAWVTPVSSDITAALAVMSVAVIGLAALAAVLGVVIGTAVIVQVQGGAGARLWRPACLFLLAAAVLYVGCHYYAPHWPGSGGRARTRDEFVPSWLVEVGWAGTLWISSYWAHPSALGGFPTREVIWMLVSPVALTALAGSAMCLIRRLGATPRSCRWAILVFAGGMGLMILFLVGAVLWLGGGHPGAPGTFAIGAIDVALLALLAIGLVVAGHLVRRAATASFRPLTR